MAQRDELKAWDSWQASSFDGVERLNLEGGSASSRCLDESCGKAWYRSKAQTSAAKHTAETGHPTQGAYAIAYQYRAVDDIVIEESDSGE